MQGLRRRVVYVTLYELIAIAATSVGLAAFADSSVERAGVAAVVSSAVAVAWNVVFNTLFERWEARQTVRGRSLGRRAAHAVGFEGGLVVMLVPLMAWWLGTSLLAAFVADLGILAFFFVYAIVFTWGFDRVFGLPASALPVGEKG